MEEAKKKILIVEDEATYQRVLADKLEAEGFISLVAKNGEEGLAMALQERPDLILLDVMMPKMDGITMLKSLRASGDWTKRLPVIILSNSNDNIVFLDAVGGGAFANGFLIKADTKIVDVIKKIKESLTVA